MNTHTERLAVDVREAAYLLSCSPRTIQNYIRVKRILARKIGRRTVVPVRALESFLRTDQPSASGNTCQKGFRKPVVGSEEP